MDVQTAKIGKGCNVDNGLDREHVDVVVDKILTCDVPTPDTNTNNKSTKSTTITALANKRETTMTHITL